MVPVTALERSAAHVAREQDEEEEFLEGPQRVWVLLGGDGAERQDSLANGRAAWLALAGPGGAAAEAFVLEPAQHSGRREPERRRTLLRKRNELLVSEPCRARGCASRSTPCGTLAVERCRRLDASLSTGPEPPVCRIELLGKRNAMPAPQLLACLRSRSATRRTNCHQSCSCRASGAFHSANLHAAQRCMLTCRVQSICVVVAELQQQHNGIDNPASCGREPSEDERPVSQRGVWALPYQGPLLSTVEEVVETVDRAAASAAVVRRVRRFVLWPYAPFGR